MKRRWARAASVLAAGLLTGGAASCCVTGMIAMPGASFSGDAPPFTDDERSLAVTLREDIEHLSVTIGERNAHRRPEALADAEAWLHTRLTGLGYDVDVQRFRASRLRGEEDVPDAPNREGFDVANLVVDRRGTSRPDEIVIIGAHYDSALHTAGADDNASGVAAALALAASLRSMPTERTVRVVFFTNEEPPWFKGPHMGSAVYARRCRERGEDIVAMVALETMAYFQSSPGTQHYPWPFSALYPSTGTFIGFVGDTGSQSLVHDAVEQFRSVASLPSEGAAVPAAIEGIDWSDHGPFWQQGYRAFMVTDTAPFRNPHYHQTSDLPDTLDVDALARAVIGLRQVMQHLATTTTRW